MSDRERKLRWDREHILRSARSGGRAGHLPERLVAEMRRRRAEGQTVRQIHDEMAIGYATVSRRTKDVRGRSSRDAA
jgi:hypothetical protein